MMVYSSLQAEFMVTKYDGHIHRYNPNPNPNPNPVVVW